jgi:hypothetical protein
VTPAALAIAILHVVTLSCASVRAVQPFKRCGKCNGFGFEATTDRKGRPERGKNCRRCKGTGARIRCGRRLLNLWRRPHRDGTR